VRLFGTNLPIGGGGYFRLLPFALTQLAMQYVNTRERQPVMFYMHPWELDPDQPRPAMAWRHRFRHTVGLAREAAKLDDLPRIQPVPPERAEGSDTVAPVAPAWLEPQGALAG
jgi:hypothetical protein